MKQKAWIQIFPVLSGVFWGSAGIFVRKFEALGFNSISIVELRIIIAVVILLAGILIADKSMLKIQLKDLWIFLGAGWLSMIGLNVCYNYAINTLTLSLAAVLLSLSPIFVLLMAAVIFKEKITGQKIFCIVLALIGCMLCSGIFKGGLSWNAAGVVVGAIAAVFYAAFSIFSKLAMERGYRPLTVSFYSLLAAGIALAFFTDWSTVSAVTAQDPMGMTGFFVLHSLCTSVLPYVLYTVGLNYIDAGKASILASAEPVAATVFGIFFYHEIPGFAEIAGLILVMAALIYLSAPQEGRLTLKKHKEA